MLPMAVAVPMKAAKEATPWLAPPGVIPQQWLGSESSLSCDADNEVTALNIHIIPPPQIFWIQILHKPRNTLSPSLALPMVRIGIETDEGASNRGKNHDPINPDVGFPPCFKPVSAKPLLETEPDHRPAPDCREGRPKPVGYETFLMTLSHDVPLINDDKE